MLQTACYLVWIPTSIVFLVLQFHSPPRTPCCNKFLSCLAFLFALPIQVDVTASIDASNSVIANAAVLQAQFVLTTVAGNTSVVAILIAQQLYIASHAAALAVKTAALANTCALQVAAAAASLASVTSLVTASVNSVTTVTAGLGEGEDQEEKDNLRDSHN